MTKAIKKLLATVFLAALTILPFSGVSQAATFSDVPSTHWAYGHLNTLSNAGVVTAYSDGSFHPSDKMTRMDALKLLLLGANPLSKVSGTHFADISTANKDYVFAETAHSYGWVKGYSDGRFGPNDGITRAQFAKMAAGILGYGTETPMNNPFPDLSATDWAAPYVVALKNHGAVNGFSDGKFHGDWPVLRAEAAKIVGAWYVAPEKSILLSRNGAVTAAISTNTIKTSSVTAASNTGTTIQAASTGATVARANGLDIAAIQPTLTTVGVGATNVKVMDLKFSAGPNDQSVTKLVLSKAGISNNSNISGVYLFDGKIQVARAGISSENTVTFENSAGLFKVGRGSSTNVEIHATLDNSASAGTFSFSVVSKDSIATSATSDIAASFPLAGPTFNVVSADIASATVTVNSSLTTGGASSSAAVNIDPGQTQYTFAVYQVQSGSADNVLLRSLSVRQNGSVAADAIKNYAIYDNATGAKIADGAASSYDSRTIIFTPSSDYLITKGKVLNIALKGDIVAGTDSTVNFSIDQIEHFDAVGAAGGIGIKMSNASSFPIGTANGWYHVNVGKLSINKSSSSPLTSIPRGAIGTTLAKFDMVAVGEDIEVRKIIFTIPATETFSTNLTNFKVTDGTTTYGSADSVTLASVAGTTASINLSPYLVIKAGNTSPIQVTADIGASESDGSIVSVGVAAPNTNITAVGRTSNRNITPSTLSAVYGNSISVGVPSVTVSQNSSFVPTTIVKGAAGVTLASFLMNSNIAEDVNISSVKITNNTSLTADAFSTSFKNLVVKINGTQHGQTYVTPEANGVDTSFVFNSYAKVKAGETAQIDIIGDVLSTSTFTSGNAMKLTAVGAVGVTSQTTPTTSGLPLALQTISLSNVGTLVASLDSSSPVSAQLVAGNSGTTLGMFKLTAGNVEDIKIYSIKFKNVGTSTDGLSGIALYDGSTQVGYSVPSLNSSQEATFSLQNSPLTITKNTSKVLSVKASAPSNATSNKTVRLNVQSITAYGKDSSAIITYDGGTTVGSSDSDLSTTIASQTATTGIKTTAAAAVAMAYGTDGVYIDMDNSNTVTVGDIRVAAGNAPAKGQGFAVGSTVRSGDADAVAATTLALQTAAAGLKSTAPAATAFILGTYKAYIDTDNSNTVTAADTRVSGYSIGEANGMLVVKNKVTVALASDSAAGTLYEGTARDIAKFRFSNSSNVNNASSYLKSLNVLLNRSNVTVDNIKLIDSSNSQQVGTTVTVPGTSGVATFTGFTLEIAAGSYKDVIVRADVHYQGVGTSLNGSLQAALSDLGSLTSTGSVGWNDSVNNFVWVDTGTTSLSANNLTYSGGVDSYAPYLVGVSMSNKSAGTAGSVETGDILRFTYSEPILSGSLPTGAVGDVTFDATNGLTVNALAGTNSSLGKVAFAQFTALNAIATTAASAYALDTVYQSNDTVKTTIGTIVTTIETPAAGAVATADVTKGAVKDTQGNSLSNTTSTVNVVSSGW